jgi:hypothetical protein
MPQCQIHHGLDAWEASSRKAMVQAPPSISRCGNGAPETLRLPLTPLLVPDDEARDVHLHRLSATGRRGYALDHEVVRDDLLATMAFLAVAWTDPKPREAVDW